MIPKSDAYGLVNKDSSQIIFKGSLKDCRRNRKDGCKLVTTFKKLGEYWETQKGA